MIITKLYSIPKLNEIFVKFIREKIFLFFCIKNNHNKISAQLSFLRIRRHPSRFVIAVGISSNIKALLANLHNFWAFRKSSAEISPIINFEFYSQQFFYVRE